MQASPLQEDNAIRYSQRHMTSLGIDVGGSSVKLALLGEDGSPVAVGEPGETPRSLVHAADVALYEAKSRGGAQVVCSSD